MKMRKLREIRSRLSSTQPWLQGPGKVDRMGGGEGFAHPVPEASTYTPANQPEPSTPQPPAMVL